MQNPTAEIDPENSSENQLKVLALIHMLVKPLGKSVPWDGACQWIIDYICAVDCGLWIRDYRFCNLYLI